jgi:hypothetical protein
MIQRIQTIFLFLSSCGFLGQFATDFATSNISVPTLLADKVYEIQDSPILMGITILGALISLGAIFLYNNRPLQNRLSIFSLVLALFLPLVAMLLVYNEKTAMSQTAEINDAIGAYLPIISVIASFLAMRYITKDEKIVKSMDRLR